MCWCVSLLIWIEYWLAKELDICHQTSNWNTQCWHHMPFLYPPSRKLKGGVYWFHVFRPPVRQSVRPFVYPSVCGQNCVHSVSSTILVVSISYLHILSSNFRILWICNFDIVFFWLGIQYDSIVWVIMGRQRVSSERRHSSCAGILVVLINGW